MTRRPRIHGVVLGILGLLVFAGVWRVIGPAQFGGSATYLIASGTSMLPTFRAGDLVVVHHVAQYRVGDVVAYHNRQLGVIVLHRIKRRDGDRYVFQGDNNAWEDRYHPTASDLVGKLWLHESGWGAWLGMLRSPRHLAIIAGLLVVTIMVEEASKRVRRQRKRRWTGRLGGRHEGGVSWGQGTASGALVFGALSAVLLCSVLWLYHVSPTTQTSAMIAYTQAGQFQYSAHADGDDYVYPAGLAQTGQPLYRHIIDMVALNFAYHFTSQEPHEISGTGNMEATLSNGEGWSRSWPIGDVVQAQGDELQLQGTLDLAQVGTMMDKFLKATATRSGVFKLTVTPQIAVQGILAGKPLKTDFQPNLAFQVSPSVVTLTGGADGIQPMLHPSAAGALPTVQSAPNQIHLLGVQFSVATARKAALLSMLACILGLLLCLWLMARERRLSEPQRIRLRYGHMLLNARDLALETRGTMVWVEDMPSLVRLAHQYERLILHHADRNGVHDYAVQDVDCVYCFRAQDERHAAAPSMSAEEAAHA